MMNNVKRKTGSEHGVGPGSGLLQIVPPRLGLVVAFISSFGLQSRSRFDFEEDLIQEEVLSVCQTASWFRFLR